jgi:nitrogen regulatory protein PII
VKEALTKIGIQGITVPEVKGKGTRSFTGMPNTLSPSSPKVEVALADFLLERAIGAAGVLDGEDR